jgi:hypothetical protein
MNSGKRATGLVVALVLLTGGPTFARDGDPGWITYSDPTTATTVQLPAGIFTEADGVPEPGTGQRWRTADGRATFSIYSLPNAARASPQAYLAEKLKIPRSSLQYRRVTGKFFAI